MAAQRRQALGPDARHLPEVVDAASFAAAQAEVLRALRRGRPGKASGLDGVPLELYRRFSDFFAPLLSLLFSAIISTGSLPPGFHQGLITILHKSGDRSDPGNYRPITLLGTDYRLFALVLARRLGPRLPHIVDPVQTAFVPGRCIGDNILTLQLLPHHLRRAGRWALAVFCDFRKAYDTIDRGFLLRSLETLGLPPGFVSLVRLLLSSTSACCLVNGYISAPASFAAGVRQGCPLAPLLYLFVAQALLAFLRSRAIGVPDLLPGSPLTTCPSMYADDAQALLASTTQLPPFLAAMDTFAAATGQHLNPSKSRILLLGAVPPHADALLPPPAARRGIPVVPCTTALGVPLCNGPLPPDVTAAAWAARLASVEAVYTRVSRLGLSTFGRGFASAGYGVPKLLFQAEFLGQPPPAVAQRLRRITARLVDRSLSPASSRRSFAGLHHSVLFGRPAHGGFGALPLREHITARHARWAARLITAPAGGSAAHLAPAPPQPAPAGRQLAPAAASLAPWVSLARALLGDASPAGLLSWLPGVPPPGRMAPLPPPLHRLHAAIALLPPPTDVAPAPLPPGPWCLSIPLWGNPLLSLLSPTHPDGIDLQFIHFHEAGVATLGQLLGLEAALAACPSQAAYSAATGPRRRLLRNSYAFAERHVAVEQAAQLLAALPQAWLTAARAAAATAPAAPQPVLGTVFSDLLLPRLGWQLPGQRPITLASLTVRAATSLLTRPAADARAATYLAPFAALATSSTAPAAAHLAELQAAMQRLWRLPWENGRKEAFWRLAYDALPTAARMHVDRPCSCGCPAPRPDRLHHFWACPVAQAVVSDIQAACATAAAPAPPPPPLALAHLWLARTPAGLHAGIWGVVCLAAIEAMDRGRRGLAAARLRQERQQTAAQPQPSQQRQLTLDAFLQLSPAGTAAAAEPPPPPPPAAEPSQAAAGGGPPPDPLTSAIRRARSTFWSLLADFEALDCIPSSWLSEVPPTHPFFRPCNGRIRMRPLPRVGMPV